jgi:DNA recombination protein RmuC
MQYSFKNGDLVDAVINIKDKYLPIDSKFSLDNYQRCVDSENEEDKSSMPMSLKKI